MTNHPTEKLWVTCCVLFFVGAVTLAQTNAETNAGIQFNFSVPGAKSLALGGAFLGLADDATTAYANPAGLTIMSRPEISVEVRYWNYTHVYTDRGRLEGQPSNEGVDNIRGLRHGEDQDGVTGASFLSWVYPRQRWAIAFYRHELVNFEANFRAQGAFLDEEFRFRLAPSQTVVDLNIVNYGLSAAYSFGEEIRVGASLSYYDFSIDSITDRFRLPSLNSPPVYSSDQRRSSQIQRGDDTDWGITAGFLWEIDKKWSVGGLFRAGSRFKFDARVEKATGALQAGQEAEFRVPDVYGLGIAYRPTETITIMIDYNHVKYSQLATDLINIFGPEVAEPELDRFTADDADELHLGFEYFFLQSRIPIAIRLGSWYDPDHKIRFEGESPDFRALFQPGDDQIHYSAGFGISTRRLQIDVAFDGAENVQTFSFSTVIRF